MKQTYKKREMHEKLEMSQKTKEFISDLCEDIFRLPWHYTVFLFEDLSIGTLDSGQLEVIESLIWDAKAVRDDGIKNNLGYEGYDELISELEDIIHKCKIVEDRVTYRTKECNWVDSREKCACSLPDDISDFHEKHQFRFDNEDE